LTKAAKKETDLQTFVRETSRTLQISGKKGGGHCANHIRKRREGHNEHKKTMRPKRLDKKKKTPSKDNHWTKRSLVIST